MKEEFKIHNSIINHDRRVARNEDLINDILTQGVSIKDATEKYDIEIETCRSIVSKYCWLTNHPNITK